MSNIDKFDILSGRVLARLYSEFPKPCTLEATDFGYKDSVYEFLSDPNATTIKENSDIVFFTSAINFLVANKIIDAAPSGVSFNDARLTLKGLSLLKKTPKSLSNGSNLGSWLTKAIKTGGDELIKTAAKEFFETALTTI